MFDKALVKITSLRSKLKKLHVETAGMLTRRSGTEGRKTPPKYTMGREIKGTHTGGTNYKVGSINCKIEEEPKKNTIPIKQEAEYIKINSTWT